MVRRLGRTICAFDTSRVPAHTYVAVTVLTADKLQMGEISVRTRLTTVPIAFLVVAVILTMCRLLARR